MKTRVELKTKAKDLMRGKILKLFVCFLIVGLILGGLSLIPVLGSIADVFLAPVLSFGCIVVVLEVSYGKEIEFAKLFCGFQNFWQCFLTGFLVEIFIILWSLLLIVPGVIKAISYSMSYYILAEHPDMKALEAIHESKKIMDGHKKDFFVLMLSFIPWFLVVFITCGIASIYVIPYVQMTTAEFYHEIKDGSNTQEKEMMDA